jgi:hypothetical protein
MERDTRRAPTTFGIVYVAIMTVALQGCAALPVSSLGGTAFQAGSAMVAKTGTEYTL